MLGLLLALAVTVLVILAVARLIRDRRRFEAMRARERDHVAELAQLRAANEAELDRVRAERDERVSELEGELGRERARVETERRWADELRSQVDEMHKQRGLLSDPDDIRSLVLHTAITLL